MKGTQRSFECLEINRRSHNIYMSERIICFVNNNDDMNLFSVIQAHLLTSKIQDTFCFLRFHSFF